MSLPLAFVLSLAVGLGVGALYALLGVRSPAPPLIALAGLLGMVLGERGALALKARLSAGAVHVSQPASARRQDGEGA